MNFQLLFQTDRPIRVGLIGAGAFGKSFLFQAQRIPNLEIVAVCDQDIGNARQASLHGGATPSAMAVCTTLAEARTAVDSGKTVVADDGMLLTELPLDVLVEATGSPEAGARHGLAAIRQGKHVIMVSKETASVVGPILSHKAKENGVVYTTGDGDQPSMCIGLITWAESIGLEIVCAGKAAETDFVYDSPLGTVSNGRQTVHVGNGGAWNLWPLSEDDDVCDRVVKRGRTLAVLPQSGIPEYTEMAIVMNNTGYGFDRSNLHGPVIRIQEMADVLRHMNDGGILGSAPVIDVVNCLRRTDEPGFAGGVFVVVKCHDAETWELLRRKGHMLSRNGTHAMIYLPFHLLGVETATSIFSAAVLGLPTGGADVRPIVEVGLQATESLQAGSRLVMDRGHAIAGVTPLFFHPKREATGTPIPFYMAAGNALCQDVKAGTTITYDMVQEPPDSTLWALKREQDRLFL